MDLTVLEKPSSKKHHPLGYLWSRVDAAVRRLAAHVDPLTETSNWVALTVGSHLPLWPLYVLWVAGWQAWPSSLLTIALSPLFLAVPMISRRSSLAGRIATPTLGIINTLFTTWILGPASGTMVFLVPCAVLAAISFRRTERGIMLALTALPPVVWYLSQKLPFPPLHHYNAAIAHRLLILNVLSIGVLVMVIGWLQVGVYRRMERS